MARCRAWVFTLNNYDQQDLDRLTNPGDLNYRYCVFGQEMGKLGTPHLQGFVYFKEKMYRSMLSKKFKWWVDPSKDTKKDYTNAIEYCKKQGSFWEWGDPPEQGRRDDLSNIAEDIINGGAKLRDIAINGNYQQIRWAETCSRYVEPPFRYDQQVIWVYGKAGNGKTRHVYESEAVDSIYKWNGNKWFDGYDGHEVLFLDDLRPDILPTSYLLQLLDIYPMRIEVKGGFVPLKCKKIYITCVHRPEDTFIGANEPIEQLLRRVTKIVHIDEI